jgi:hypothetical protein
MKTSLLTDPGGELLRSLALVASAPCLTERVTQLLPDELLALGPAFRKSLDLNTSQLALWQQIDSRSRAVLCERAARGERLQRLATALLERANVELRGLNILIEAEAAASSAEDSQLRELWVAMNEALDDKQRQVLATLVAEQMRQVPDGGKANCAPGKPYRASQDRAACTAAAGAMHGV